MAKRPLTESEQVILDRLHPVHREALRRYQVIQEAIITKLRKERARRPASIIHHYTKPDVFPLILRSGELFLSDYSKMIDTSEIEYGFNTGMEVLQYELADSWKTGRAKLLVWMMEQIAKEGLGKYLKGYVGCLSKAEDDLPQWREYGGGETGFCLSFDEQELDKAFEAFKVGKAIYSGGGFEVVYDDARLRRIMKQYVDNALHEATWLSDRPGRKNLWRAVWEIAANLAYAFIYTALYFKHWKYKSEHEYRYFVAVHPADQIAARLTRPGKFGEEVEYFAMDWKTEHAHALKQIWIGPAVTEAQGRETIRQVLEREGIGVGDIRMSLAPPTRRG